MTESLSDARAVTSRPSDFTVTVNADSVASDVPDSFGNAVLRACGLRLIFTLDLQCQRNSTIIQTRSCHTVRSLERANRNRKPGLSRFPNLTEICLPASLSGKGS